MKPQVRELFKRLLTANPVFAPPTGETIEDRGDVLIVRQEYGNGRVHVGVIRKDALYVGKP